MLSLTCTLSLSFSHATDCSGGPLASSQASSPTDQIMPAAHACADDALLFQRDVTLLSRYFFAQLSHSLSPSMSFSHFFLFSLLPPFIYLFIYIFSTKDSNTSPYVHIRTHSHSLTLSHIERHAQHTQWAHLIFYGTLLSSAQLASAHTHTHTLSFSFSLLRGAGQ